MLRLIAAVIALIYSSAFAAGVPVSEASVREMLAVAEVRKLVDGMKPQFEAFIKTSMQQAMGGRVLSPDEQKIADKMGSKMAEIMSAEMSWEKLEPLYLIIYQRSFTQEEVDGMLAFYKSPAGVALVRKMPLVMKESMNAMQQLMGPLMERIQKATEEAVAEINVENHKNDNPPTLPSH